MIEEPRIFPECNVDTLFIELITRKTVEHVFGNSNVAKKLQSRSHLKEVSIGVVDNDKVRKQPPYFSQFKSIRTYNSHLILKQHKQNKNQYLIFICPASERFIQSCARAKGYDGIPTDLDELKRITKDPNLKSNNDFKNKLSTVIQRNPAPIVQLKGWINELLPPVKSSNKRRR